MSLYNLQIIQLCIGLTLMLLQLRATEKKCIHLLFAAFCGSVAIAAAQKLSVESVGAFHYLIGMGTCFTCNISWLIARVLFREKNAVSKSPIILAISIATLIIANQAFHFHAAYGLEQTNPLAIHIAIGELLTLLSSTILVLTFWEGLRGYSADTRARQAIRITFMLFFCLAVGSVMIGTKLLPETLYGETTRNWIVTICSTVMMCVFQSIIIWHRCTKTALVAVNLELEPDTNQTSSRQSVTENSAASKSIDIARKSNEEKILGDKLHNFLIEQKQFLQPNLKVIDLASKLDVSEYKISRVIRLHFQTANFNSLVNALRVKHAKAILEDETKTHWSVLVVGLESGFASVGPFTRAFKAYEGCTPGQYRKQQEKTLPKMCI